MNNKNWNVDEKKKSLKGQKLMTFEVREEMLRRHDNQDMWSTRLGNSATRIKCVGKIAKSLMDYIKKFLFLCYNIEVNFYAKKASTIHKAYLINFRIRTFIIFIFIIFLLYFVLNLLNFPFHNAKLNFPSWNSKSSFALN